MAKAKKEVDLENFSITQVENGWSIEARDVKTLWHLFDGYRPHRTYVFSTMDDLLNWIEVNV